MPAGGCWIGRDATEGRQVMCRSRTVNAAVKVFVKVSKSEADSVCPGEMDSYLWVPLGASESLIHQGVDKFG